MRKDLFLNKEKVGNCIAIDSILKSLTCSLWSGSNKVWISIEENEFELAKELLKNYLEIEEIEIPAGREIKATAIIKDENTITLTVNGKEYVIRCNQFKDWSWEKRYIHKIYKREKCIKSGLSPERLLSQMKDKFWECTNRNLFENLIAKLG